MPIMLPIAAEDGLFIYSMCNNQKIQQRLTRSIAWLFSNIILGLSTAQLIESLMVDPNSCY
jgi:hypothetical protein